MRFCYHDYLSDGLLSSDSVYSTMFPAANLLDRRLSKRWRSYRAPNLMLHGNCDSEDAPTIDGTPAAATGGTWALDETIKYEGTGSWKLTKTVAAGTPAIAYLVDSTSTTDMHGFTAGQTIEMRLRMRTNCATPSYGSLYFQQYIGGAWVTIVLLQCVAANTWEFKTGYGTISATATGVRIIGYVATAASAGECAWLDAIKVYVKNELVEFGHCELATESPTLDGTPDAALNCTWARSAAQKYTGTYSWLLTKTTAAGAGSATAWLNDNTAATDDMHGFVAGSTYKFTGALYRSALAAAGLSGLYFYEYYNATWNATKLFVPVNATAWETFSKTITINTATTSIRWRLYVDTNEVVNTLLYADDLSITLEPRIILDAYSAVNPTYAAILGHNLSSGATITLEGNSSASWTSPAFTKTFTWDDDIVFDFVSASAYRYWSWKFHDANNEDGYIEIGLAPVGTYFQPTNGAARVFPEMPEDKSLAEETEAGEVIGSEGVKLNMWDINIAWMATAQKVLFETMMDEIRNFTPILWVLEEDDTASFPVRYGRIAKYDFTHIITLDAYACKFTFREAK